MTVDDLMDYNLYLIVGDHQVEAIDWEEDYSGNLTMIEVQKIDSSKEKLTFIREEIDKMIYCLPEVVLTDKTSWSYIIAESIFCGVMTVLIIVGAFFIANYFS